MAFDELYQEIIRDHYKNPRNKKPLSHIKAVEEGREARIQAIDMGRRGLHNEGAALMKQRLEGKIAIDFETARRLFTLVCVLHQRI